jgi:hypothetical protein
MASFTNNRFLDVKITDVTIPSVCNTNNLLFDIYFAYPLIPSNLANKNPDTLGSATGITYSQLTSIGGYPILVPKSATTIFLKSDCLACSDFSQNISCSINVAFANDTGTVCNTIPTERYTTPNGYDTSINNNTAPGTIFYSDIKLQTPIIGFSYAKLVDPIPIPPISYIYSLDPSNGEIISFIQNC